ncbi:MAG: zinc-ribbon domain-containing protein [Oscillospiraceae bacterium]|nr:zinc-ribbon domain-containing protein [Oscillospiraceae bacterium]
MYCKKCGNELTESEQFCGKCGANAKESINKSEKNAKESINTSDKKGSMKCLPAFILGLIGSIFGIFGGLCTTMCSGVVSSSRGNAAFILIFLGAIVGLIGACLCMNKPKIGSILELASAIMMIICAFGISGSDFMTVIALLLLLAGGIIGAVYSFLLKRK